jgi:hypothetical protein
MSQLDVTKKAKQLLARRNAPHSPWFYVWRDWHRQLLFFLVYVAVPIALWYLELTMLAGATGCFFAGAKIRDMRWWVALSKEWPTTAEFVDRQKVEELAGDPVLS